MRWFRCKYIWIIICPFIITILIAISIIYLYFCKNRGEDNYYIDSFNENISSFNNVVEYCKSLENEKQSLSMRIYFEYESTTRNYMVVWKNSSMSKENNYEKLELSENIKLDFEKVYEAFKDLCWDGIEITSTQISFTTEGNRNAFVYSRNGYRPKYMRSSNERFNVYITHIKNDWYYLKS